MVTGESGCYLKGCVAAHGDGCFLAVAVTGRSDGTYRPRARRAKCLVMCVALCRVKNHPTHDGRVPREKQRLGESARGIASAAGTRSLQMGRVRARLRGLTVPWLRAHISTGIATTRALLRLKFLISGTTSPSLGLLGLLLHAVKIPQAV